MLCAFPPGRRAGRPAGRAAALRNSATACEGDVAECGPLPGQAASLWGWRQTRARPRGWQLGFCAEPAAPVSPAGGVRGGPEAGTVSPSPLAVFCCLALSWRREALPRPPRVVPCMSAGGCGGGCGGGCSGGCGGGCVLHTPASKSSWWLPEPLAFSRSVVPVAAQRWQPLRLPPPMRRFCTVQEAPLGALFRTSTSP